MPACVRHENRSVPKQGCEDCTDVAGVPLHEIAHETGIDPYEDFARTTDKIYASMDVRERLAAAQMAFEDGTKLSQAAEKPADRIGDAKTRKAVPICSGVFDYFPDALLAVAELSRIGNDQHNPGQPLHWARGKSGDESDALLRHLVDRGTIDTDGVRHSTKVAWRALANLQKELEAANPALGISRGSRAP